MPVAEPVTHSCRAPVPGPRALAELHLPWARPPRAAYLALCCRPQPAHILLCPRRPDCTARISYLTRAGANAALNSPSYLLSGFCRHLQVDCLSRGDARAGGSIPGPDGQAGQQEVQADKKMWVLGRSVFLADMVGGLGLRKLPLG